MVAFSYVATAVLVPQISGADLAITLLTYIGVAIATGVAIIFYYVKSLRGVAQITFYILAILMTFSGVASWSGLSLWNVPFNNVEIFQVSMALFDMLTAVAMFTLAIADIQETER